MLKKSTAPSTCPECSNVWSLSEYVLTNLATEEQENWKYCCDCELDMFYPLIEDQERK